MKFILTSDTHFGFNGKTQAKHVKFWKKIQKEIEEQDVKALIWAGDISSIRLQQIWGSLKQAREYVNIPILLVWGNHDYWNDTTLLTFEETKRIHKDYTTKFEIHDLEKEPFIIDDVIICGWGGWYGNGPPPSNDTNYMFNNVQGVPVHSYMASRAF